MCAPHLTASTCNTSSLCLPVSVFFPLLLTLQAINEAARTTDPTTSTTTTATTAPMIATGPFPEGPPPPAAGGSSDDVVTLLLSSSNDLSAIGGCSKVDAKRDDATLLGETLGAVVIATPAMEVIRDGEAADVIDRMELLMTSGTGK